MNWLSLDYNGMGRSFGKLVYNRTGSARFNRQELRFS